jgi:lipopolysaccharide assembly outer membrane protein LptD (OstA)
MVAAEEAVTLPQHGGRHTPALVLLLLLVACAAGAAQVTTPAAARRDTASTRADSLRTPLADSAATRPSSGVDTVVTYSAVDSIVYALDTKTMHLYGTGDIKYREMGLAAERIDINWTTSLLTARGVADTADSTGRKFRGLPKLTDGGEKYDGSMVQYNFKSRKGRIDVGKTAIENGLYYGEEIKKIDSDVLFVGDGMFTTCDLEHPHYYFGSPTMKVMVRERVVARPVYLYIADVPVFALPFGVFPSQRGRRSGVIAPAFGESGDLGRYLLHLGYYWAMTDYTDLGIRADGYTKGSWALYGDFRYALRYNFSGGVSAAVRSQVRGEAGDPGYSRDRDFNMSVSHSQEFNPSTRLVVDFTFTSGSYYQNATTDFNDLLRQNVISNATFSKSWEGTPHSLTVNIRRDQNLRPDSGKVEVSEILPGISFTRSQTYPFRPSKGGVSDTQQWYELVGYNYSLQASNTRTRTRLGGGTSVLDERRGVLHTLSTGASPKVGYFTVAPFFNYAERWYDKSIDREIDPATNGVVTRDVKGFRAVRTFDMGVSASTKLYGILQPGIWGIKGIRHQVIPSIRYTYQPDFSKARYGYYGTYRDTLGREQMYSHFEREVFGGASAGERQSIGFDVSNVFEMKTAVDDTSERENKFQLLNLSAGISYNLAADSLRFSELGLSYRTGIGDLVNIGGNASFNLYKFVPDPGRPGSGVRVNRLLMEDGGRLADLTSFSISIGTRLSGERKASSSGPIRTAADSLADRTHRGYVGLYDRPLPDFSIPWNLDLNWTFSQSQQDPRVKFRSSGISADLGFNLTPNWKITARTNYDLVNREFAAPQITVYRDLHCWELNFSWVPTGFNRNYRFEIRLKEPQLQDVKVTKQSSRFD